MIESDGRYGRGGKYGKDGRYMGTLVGLQLDIGRVGGVGYIAYN